MSKRRSQEKNRIKTHVKDRKSTLPKELREQYEKAEARKEKSRQEIEYMQQEAERDWKRKKFFEGIEYGVNHDKAKKSFHERVKKNKEREINKVLEQYLKEQGIDANSSAYRIRNGLIEIAYYDEDKKIVKIGFPVETFLAMKNKAKEKEQ